MTTTTAMARAATVVLILAAAYGVACGVLTPRIIGSDRQLAPLALSALNRVCVIVSLLFAGLAVSVIWRAPQKSHISPPE